MKVTVNYLAQVKQAAGISSESVEMENSDTLQELVTRIAENQGEPLRSFLLESGGGLRNSVLLIIGEEQVHWETPVQLKEGDYDFSQGEHSTQTKLSGLRQTLISCG